MIKLEKQIAKEKIMEECQIEGCKNQATITVSRPTREEERNEHIIENEGISWNYKVETYACADHLDLARREYPNISRREP